MITLVLGGARSGKSAVAEHLVARHAPPVTYVATMDPAGDPELEARVAAHRARRAASWSTVVVEPEGDLAGLLSSLAGTVLVDSLGPWVARLDAGAVEAQAIALCTALVARAGDTVLVSDEVGLAVHPSSAEGRRFRDALGAAEHGGRRGGGQRVSRRGRAAPRAALAVRSGGPGHVRRALSFLTVVGRAAVPNERTLNWFPVVGLAVGAVVGGTWWVAGRWWPASLAAVVAVAVDAAVTGGLHLDGLADSADGLIPPVSRARRLEIMADPRLGAFGVIALILVLGLRVAAFAATPAKVLVVMGLWCGSRTLMALAACTLRSAHSDGGMSAAFQGPARGAPSAVSRYGVGAYGLALACGAAALGAGSRGLVAIAAEVLAAVAVVWFAQRRLGGYTGDVLGACGVIGETVGLLVLVAR